MRLRRSSITGICAALLSVGAVAAMPVDMTLDRLLTICDAPTVHEAMAKGNELGWQKLTEPETEEWRTHFIGYNGGSVEVVGWRRDDTGGVETLSFWVAVDPNGHTACAYSTMKPAGLLDALSQRLGEPDTIDENGEAELVSASWRRDAVDYSFAQVGSSAIINIASR